MGNAHTHDRRKSGAPETGLTIEGIREKPLHQHERKQGRVEKKASPPSFLTAEGETGGEVELGSTVEEIQQSPRPAAQVEVEDDGVEATAELAMSRVIGSDKTRQGLPTIFKYGGEAKEAYVAGTFSKWEKIPMVKSQKDFVALVDLPVGEHQFKYFVDQQWTHDQGLPTTSNEVGSQNNVITIQQADFEAFAALDMDSATTNVKHKRGGETEFGQEIPAMSSFESKPGPPILPPHLLQVILNKDTPLSCEPTLLPEPNHVMINHLYALSIKDGVMVISSTQRFRKKYVTTLLYKPIEA